MLKNKNIILTSLGGAAIAAGVWYYFTKRNISIAQRYQNLFQSYEKEFFLSAQMPLTTQIKFDQLFDLAVYDENDKTMIYNRLQYQGEDITNQGKCTDAINTGSFYYDCYDCSPIRQELLKTHTLVENDEIYLVICEDCFDASKHRGHKFKKNIQGAESKFRCYCGDSNLMEEQSFCNNHQGFHKTREIAMKQKSQQPILWKGIEKFLLDSFYMVFNRMSDLLMKKSSGQSLNAQDNDQIARLNIYFSQIVAKINEIIELNPPSIHNIAQIFQLKLQRPISLSKLKKSEQFKKFNEQWIPIFCDSKNVNNDISVYEYLLTFYQFINDSNDTLLNKLFSNLNVVNESFNLFLIEKLTKYISLTIRENNIMYNSVDNKHINQKALPSFIMIIIEYGCLQKVFDHLIDSLGEDIFCPIDVLTKYLEMRPTYYAELDYIIFLLLNIAFSSFSLFSQIKILLDKLPISLIERFNNIQFVLFQTSSFQIKQINQQQNWIGINLIINKTDSIISINLLEPTILSSFFNIVTTILLNNDEQLTQKILSHLCSTFQRDVLKAREFIDSHVNTELKTFSLLFLIKLPMLIALSERQMFSQEIVNSFFSKNFKFTDNEKETKSYFLTSLQTILNIFLYNQYQPNNVFEIQNQAENSNTILGYNLIELLTKQTEWCFSPNTKIFDYFILTQSLLHLIDDTEYNNNKPPCAFILEDLKKLTNDEIEEKNKNYIFSSFNSYIKQIQQQIFDPMPIINIFGSFSDLYFSQLNTSKDSSQQQNNQQCQFEVNIKQYMATVYQLINEDIYEDDQLIFFYGIFIDQPNMTKKYINEVFLRKEIENDEENKQQLVLKPEYVNKSYFRSFLQATNEKINELINIAESKTSDKEYSTIELDLNFNDLFQYQIDLYKKIYLNYELQEKLKELHFKEKNIRYILSLQYHVFQTLLLIKQKDHPNLFSSEEIQAISNIIPLYQDQNYLEFYILSQNKTSDKQLKIYLFFIGDILRQLILEKGQNQSKIKQQELNQSKQQAEQQQS